MFELDKAHAETLNADNKVTSSTRSRRSGWSYVAGICIVLLMGCVLFWGATTQFPNQFNDVTRYQCYAVAFWQGTPALRTLPPLQCAFLDANTSSSLATKMKDRGFPGLLVSLVESQSTTQPLHTLPPEYPLLTLVPFSLPLIVPPQWYQAAYAVVMALVAGGIFFLLLRSRSRTAAIAFAIYLMIGSWATAETRFDLLTAGLTLGAVILAAKAKWKWAFALLALGTLLKFYPVVLIPPLLIAQNIQSKSRWSLWKLWRGVGVFVAICVGVTALSLLLNVAGTLNPFRYFFNRPIEVESFPATLMWLGSFIGYPLQYVFTFQSLNVMSQLASKISLLSSVLLVAGLLYTFWLQWRGKIDIFMASLLTLLIVVIAGKVFSPQYLIWLAPFVAYVGQCRWKWLVSWGMVAVLTTIIFPFIFVDLPHIIHYYPVVLMRDVLVVGIVIVLLYSCTRTKSGVKAAFEEEIAVS